MDLSLTDITKSLIPGPHFNTFKSVLISDEVSCDAQFIVHHLLNEFIKQDAPVFLIHANQTINHYNLVSQKLGASIHVAQSKDRFRAFDALNILSRECKSNSNLTNILLAAITAALVEFPSKGQNGISNHLLILIDDLSLLFALGQLTSDLAAFVFALRQFALSLPHPVTLAFLIHHDLEDQDEYEDNLTELTKLINLLSHIVDSHLKVEKLPSGYSNDVHGIISLRECAQDSTNGMMHFSHVKRQFKITDKTITVFATGLSKAVL